MELRATQRREYIRVRVALGVGFTPISAEECRRLRRERNERANLAWPEVELPQCAPGSETEGLLETLRIINEKLDFLLLRLCAGEPRRHRCRGTTIDVSGGGLCLASGVPAVVGQHLDLSLVLPTWPEIRLELLGQVQSVEAAGPGAEEQVFKLGVAFVGISEIDRDRLVRYIFQKQRECLRHGLKQA